MTLFQLIQGNEGMYVLYWYDGNYLASHVCTPEIINDKTIKLCDEHIENMAYKNLFCLAFEEVNASHIYTFNKGYVENTAEGVFIRGYDFTVCVNDKRVFYRYDISTEIMVMNSRSHELAVLNNISYSGLNVTMEGSFEVDDEVMVYDPKEDIPVYIPGTIVFYDGTNNYGIKITGNYDHINKIVMPNLTSHGTLSW